MDCHCLGWFITRMTFSTTISGVQNPSSASKGSGNISLMWRFINGGDNCISILVHVGPELCFVAEIVSGHSHHLGVNGCWVNEAPCGCDVIWFTGPMALSVLRLSYWGYGRGYLFGERFALCGMK